jgi:hypothetical protein
VSFQATSDIIRISKFQSKMRCAALFDSWIFFTAEVQRVRIGFTLIGKICNSGTGLTKSKQVSKQVKEEKIHLFDISLESESVSIVTSGWRFHFRSRIIENIVIRYITVVSLSSFACKVVDVFICRFFTGLSLRFRADTSKVTAHERIQYLLT